MKKLAQHIMLLVITVTVFLTGTGVTIVNFCCSNCAEQTLFITKVHSCCSESASGETKSCCSNSDKNSEANTCCDHTKKDHCKASRLSVDTDSSSYRPLVYNPFIWVSEAAAFLPAHILPINIESTDSDIKFESPPKIPPREYLSLIKVLII